MTESPTDPAKPEEVSSPTMASAPAPEVIQAAAPPPTQEEAPHGLTIDPDLVETVRKGPDLAKMKPFQARMYLRRLRHSADRAAEKRRQEVLQATQPSTAYEQLSLQHKRFVDAYISTGCNGADALRLIGVTTARKGKEGLAGKATAWLRNYPLLRTAIEERKAAAVQRSHDRLIKYVENLDWIATFDFRQMLDADGNLLPMRDWPDHVAGAVASIEFEEMYDGRGEERRAVGRVTKFKLWPKIESIRLLMQFHQLLQDRHIHTGANGGPILTKNTDELTDDQLAAIAFGGSPTPAEPAPSAG